MEELQGHLERARERVRDDAKRLLAATSYRDALRWSMALEDSATELTTVWLYYARRDESPDAPAHITPYNESAR